MVAFRRAMAAPAAMPEFKGNVVAVPTAPFWSDELGAIADKHEKLKKMNYFLGKNELNNVRGNPDAAEILDKFMGKAFAKANLAMMKQQKHL